MWLEIDTAIQVQILGKAVCISYKTNTLGNGMNPSILLPAMGKLEGSLVSLTLVWQPV